jgi:hypothetical protein
MSKLNRVDFLHDLKEHVIDAHMKGNGGELRELQKYAIHHDVEDFFDDAMEEARERKKMALKVSKELV